MKRRDFLVTTVLTRIAASVRPVAEAGSVHAWKATRQRGAAGGTPEIVIAGGGFGTAFIRYMAQLTGKRGRGSVPADGIGRLADGHPHLVPQLRAAQRRGVSAGELHRQHAADAQAGTRSSCRWTASSAPAATR